MKQKILEFIWVNRSTWVRILILVLSAFGITMTGYITINGVEEQTTITTETQTAAEPEITFIEMPKHDHPNIEQSSTELTSIKDEINVLKEELPKLQQHVDKFKQDIERAEGKIDDHLYIDHEQ